MAIIKNKDLKNMNVQDMSNRLTELRKELMRLNAQKARGTPPENPGKIRLLKRTIAKLIMFSEQKSGGQLKRNE